MVVYTYSMNKWQKESEVEEGWNVKNVFIMNLITARGEFLGGLEMAQKGIVA